MSAVAEPPAPPPSPPRPDRTGRLLVGILLVLFGIGWLLDVLDVADFAWGVLLSSALILIGLALVLTSRSRESHGGLISAGVVLSVLLVFGSALDFPIEGGIGDREVHPTTAGAIRSEYALGIGQLTVDLSDLAGTDLVAAEIDHMRIKVGVGELIVIAPPGVDLRVQARAGIGNVRVFGREEVGLDVELTIGPDPSTLPGLDLVLSVGLGQVEVRRG